MLVRVLAQQVLHAAVALGVLLPACSHAPGIGTRPIPLAQRPPWRTLLADSAFRVAMDTSHVTRGPELGWLVWFVTTHARPQGADTLRFDRGRIRLLVRCDPLAFKSVSEELALGDSPPLFHQEWPLSGPSAAAWRIPPTGATDDRFLRAACLILVGRR